MKLSSQQSKKISYDEKNHEEKEKEFDETALPGFIG